MCSGVTVSWRRLRTISIRLSTSRGVRWDPGAIEVLDEMLQLTADVDVDRLALAAVDARRIGTPTAYRAALSIYCGELLPENRYDDWAAGRRDEFADLAAALEGELAALGSPCRPPSLPLDASSFIGRDHELVELRALLRGSRLLTLAGTGGVGRLGSRWSWLEPPRRPTRVVWRSLSWRR